nr:oligosaccharide flippase family protein [Actinopolymorpha rutila]
MKQRALAGLFVVGSRGLAIMLVGFVGQVVLARQLMPTDFGAVAVGLAFVTFVNLFADGGLGAGLIRRPEPPDRADLGALTGLQVSVATALALGVAGIAPLFGRTGWVTAVVVASTPFLALQIPGRIVLERALAYRRLAIIELSQVIVFNLWAIAWVLAGAGVWGMASAAPVRAVVGVAAMAWASPVGVPSPRFAWRRVRGLMSFGIRFQAVTAAQLVRDQGLNTAIAALATVSTLGLVAVARRLLEVPYLLLGATFRVSFPTMSQLLARKADPAPLIERAVGVTTVGSGLVLTGLAASAPGLVPGLFGVQWRDAATILPAACLGLCVGGSVSVATQGYLYAVGDAAVVLRACVLQTLVQFLVVLVALPWIGVVAVGLGWLASNLVEAVVLGRATAARTHVRLAGRLAAPVSAGIVAGAAGWLTTRALGSDLVAGLVGGALATAAYLVLVLVLNRRLVAETVHLALSSARAVWGGGTEDVRAGVA